VRNIPQLSLSSRAHCSVRSYKPLDSGEIIWPDGPLSLLLTATPISRGKTGGGIAGLCKARGLVAGVTRPGISNGVSCGLGGRVGDEGGGVTAPPTTTGVE